MHLLERCGKEPKTSYSFRDDTLIMAFVKNGLGVTISQKLVMKAFANDVESRPLEPGRSRIIGLASTFWNFFFLSEIYLNCFYLTNNYSRQLI